MAQVMGIISSFDRISARSRAQTILGRISLLSRAMSLHARTTCRRQVCAVPLFALVLLHPLAHATQQNSPQRDPQALAFLSQALTAAGGSDSVGAIVDLTALGSITYSWANDQVQGTTTVKSRGLAQFRLDSQVSGGTWSFIVSNGAGVLNLPDDTSTSVAYHNTLNAGSLTMPIILVSAAVLDTSVSVTDGGLVPLGSGQARKITIQQNLSAATDPTGQLSKITTRDFFFDPSSFLILQVQDTVHPDSDMVNGGVLRILGFSGYQPINSILVPFAISQSVDGQTLWSVQLTSIAFNTGLSDTDFQF